MNPKIVEKYFNNQATPDETRRVLEWFETPEGWQYLQERLDIDQGLMDRKELQSMVPELDSDQLYQSIQNRIKRERRRTVRRDSAGRKSTLKSHLLKVAAAVLVILTVSVFYFTTFNETPDTVADSEPIHIQTESDQQREITLSDGTIIQLNSNSEITISEDFLEGNRELTLTGEAYFDVAHDPEQPFIIHANESSIRVLGTAFNVRSLAGEDNVQVAVVEGRVSFTNTASKLDEHTVILTKGQYGYMDTNTRSILVDDLAVDNYLAWKSGEFVFEELTLKQVCTQLNRLYDVDCGFADEEIKDLQLTSRFSNESLKKTLSVIALSLNIEFDKEGKQVIWRNP